MMLTVLAVGIITLQGQHLQCYEIPLCPNDNEQIFLVGCFKINHLTLKSFQTELRVC